MKFNVGDIVYCESKLIGGLPTLFEIVNFLDYNRIDVELKSLSDWKLNRSTPGILEENVDYRQGYVFSWYTKNLVKLPYDNSLNRKLYPKRKEWRGFLIPEDLADKLTQTKGDPCKES